MLKGRTQLKLRQTSFDSRHRCILNVRIMKEAAQKEPRYCKSVCFASAFLFFFPSFYAHPSFELGFSLPLPSLMEVLSMCSV